MRLGIDIREACRDKRTGKGQWTFGFVRELLLRDCDLVLFTDQEVSSELFPLIKNNPQAQLMVIKKYGFSWHWSVAQAVRQNSSIDAYVSPVSYIIPFLLGRSKKVIPVVHDLIAFRNEPHDKRATFIEKLTLKRTVKNAALIFTVSETTRKDVLQKFPNIDASRVQTIFADSFLSVSKSMKKDDGIILMIGTLCPRKNQTRLIHAYATLPDDVKKKHPLVLVGGRGWMDDDIVDLAQKTLGVSWKQYLPEEECLKLLSSASVFAYPSLYEGFGLPLIDAFRAGVPVLTSDRGSMKELAQDAALLVDPISTQSISDGLRRLLTDNALRSLLQERGVRRAKDFSWKRTVDLFLSAAKVIDKRA